MHDTPARSITITELQAAKHDLESEVRDLLVDFVNRTGVSVTDLRFDIYDTASGEKRVTSVRAELALSDL